MPRPLRPVGERLVDDVINRGNDYDAFGATPPERHRRWSSFVHQVPDPNELASLGRNRSTIFPTSPRSIHESRRVEALDGHVVRRPLLQAPPSFVVNLRRGDVSVPEQVFDLDNINTGVQE